MKFATLNDALIERRSSARTIHYIEGENNERALSFADFLLFEKRRQSPSRSGLKPVA